MKKATSKLGLRRETIHTLVQPEFTAAVGGNVTTCTSVASQELSGCPVAADAAVAPSPKK